MPEFSPTASSFYHQLEILTMTHQVCEIIFRAENGAKSIIRDNIAALFKKEGVDWLKTGSGLPIALPSLIEVNGMRPLDAC